MVISSRLAVGTDSGPTPRPIAEDQVVAEPSATALKATGSTELGAAEEELKEEEQPTTVQQTKLTTGTVVAQTSTPTRISAPGDHGVNPLEFEGSVDSNNELPSSETLRKIENYVVLDRHGKTHTFRSIYTGEHVARRVLIIFVRHFFCGVSRPWELGLPPFRAGC
jgi:hypothetical protein